MRSLVTVGEHVIRWKHSRSVAAFEVHSSDEADHGSTASRILRKDGETERSARRSARRCAQLKHRVLTNGNAVTDRIGPLGLYRPSGSTSAYGCLLSIADISDLTIDGVIPG